MDRTGPLEHDGGEPSRNEVAGERRMDQDMAHLAEAVGDRIELARIALLDTINRQTRDPVRGSEQFRRSPAGVAEPTCRISAGPARPLRIVRDRSARLPDAEATRR